MFTFVIKNMFRGKGTKHILLLLRTIFRHHTLLYQVKNLYPFPQIFISTFKVLREVYPSIKRSKLSKVTRETEI